MSSDLKARVRNDLDWRQPYFAADVVRELLTALETAEERYETCADQRLTYEMERDEARETIRELEDLLSRDF